ncbi:hypothetical protein Pfo_000775 [Paulownia fortunei]|nr:hypothetical protein Pfo_000775 [Paulownia fortunei]
MEFSEVFGFLIILKESIKLLRRNGKFMASIAILSLLLPSILFLFFSHFYQSLMDDMNASFMKPSGPDSGSNPSQIMLKYVALLLAVEIAFLLAYLIISHFSGIATILVSAASYSGNSLSLKDLFSSIKRTWRRPLTTSFRVSRHSSARYLSLVVVLAAFLVIMYPNIITISVAIILGITVVVFQLYSSVVSALSIVVSVVEDRSMVEALEKAAELVKGQHLHGFMLNLFINLLFLITFLVYWVILDHKGSLNLTTVGLFFVNIFSTVKMVLFMAYTVLYFQCKKHHGEEIDIHGNLQYTKLPTTTLDNDIP